MKKINIAQLDSFTGKPFKGNPAAVVTDGDGVSVNQMQLIAREMNLSETAFVCSPARPFADIRLRWFTPEMEVDLCGHGTIAAFQALADEGKLGLNKPGKHSFKVETISGILPVHVLVKDDEDTVFTKMGIPVPEYEPVNMDLKRLCNLIGASEDDLDPRLQPMHSKEQFVIPLKTKEILFNLRPDFITMHALRMIMVPITLDTIDAKAAVHIRFFGPSVGVKEDPVTGSMQGLLGKYLFDQNIVDKSSNPISYIGEQGYAIDRPGNVIVEIYHVDNTVYELAIIGQAVPVLTGKIHLED